MLQPSLFEGWSTTVEEAKSVGKPILLSCLPVHYEQNPPRGVFFDPMNADDLAEAMQTQLMHGTSGPHWDMEKAARANLLPRTRQFGETFMAIAREVAPE